jgi:hypothetical protein
MDCFLALHDHTGSWNVDSSRILFTGKKKETKIKGSVQAI